MIGMKVYKMTNCTKEYSAQLVEKYWEKEFNKIQAYDFPPTREFEITDKECANEVHNLETKDNNWKTASKLIIKYHKSLRYANQNKCLSPYNFWQQIKKDPEKFKKFYENRLRCSDWFKEKNGQNEHFLHEGFVPLFIYGIGMTTSRKAGFVSYFKPSLAKKIIKQYLNEFNTIFDPCSGYSGRMMGSVALGKDYIGQDVNDSSVKESLEIFDFMKKHLKNKSVQVNISVKDSLETTGDYDCLFTCPPYGDKEEWVDSSGRKITSDMSCDMWIEEFLKNYNCKRYVFVVDDILDRYKPFVKEELVNTSHFGSNKEYIVVINKDERDKLVNE